MRTVIIALLLSAFTACHKESKPKPQSSKREQREQAITQASAEQLATATFAAALREVIDWRQTLPQLDDILVKELTTRLQAIPTKDLPPGLSQPWDRLLQAPPSQRAKATQEVNQALATRGYIDLRL